MFTDQMSWIEQDCERSESRTRIALDQSRELQSLASSTLSERAAAAIFGRRSELTRTDRERRHRLCVFLSLSLCACAWCSFLRINGSGAGGKFWGLKGDRGTIVK